MVKPKYLNYDNPAGSLRNKTGEWRNFHPVVDKSKCINCAICQQYCPEGCISQVNVKTQMSNVKTKVSLRDDIKNKPYYTADLDYCKGCGICPEVCPVKCIRMEKEK